MRFLLPLLHVAGAVQGAPPPPPPPFPLLALSRELGLSPDQHRAIHALLEERRDAMRAAHRAAQQAREAFHRAMVDASRSQAEVESIQRQEAEAHRAEALAAHGLLLEAAKLLTADQRAAYQRLSATLPPPPPPRPDRGEGGDMGRSPRHEGGDRPRPGAGDRPRPEGPGEDHP